MLQADFIMIYIIHKIRVLPKITIISKSFLRSIIDFYILKIIMIFFVTYNDGCSSSKEDKYIKENTIKDVKNLFKLYKLKRETNDAEI